MKFTTASDLASVWLTQQKAGYNKDMIQMQDEHFLSGREGPRDDVMAGRL